MAIVLIAGIFTFLRFYNLDQSFLFQNDMGRDMKVLQEWHDTGRPPLLGPQTSVMAFNQSAVYFYLLYPGFLISSGHPISSVYTLGTFYLLFLLGGYYFLHHNKKIFNIFLISFLLLSIHPQYIIQGRFVWNPSFITPLIITSIISYYLLLQNYSLKKLIVFSFSIALAVSISYSATPILIAIFIHWLSLHRQHFTKYFSALSISFLVINLPTIAFELRHKFLLTQSMFTKNTVEKSSLSLHSRFTEFSRFTFPADNLSISLYLAIFTLLVCLFLVIKYRHKSNSFIFLIASLYLLITLITFTIPFPIHSHYIFGFTSLFFLLIGTLPQITSTLVIVVFSLFYLAPPKIEKYFTPAPRTYQQMMDCYSLYCDQFKEPTFVSLQSGLLPFHNGPEHRYLLRKAGCQTKEIEKESGSAKYMTVVVESSNFDSKVKYYELDLFGKNKEIFRLSCQPNFSVVTLEKI